MRKLTSAHWAALLAVVLSIAAVTFTVSDQPTPSGGHQKSYTFKVDRSGAPGVQTGTVTAPAPIQNAIAPNLESGLKTETPAGISPQQLAAVQQAVAQTKATLPPLPTGGATAGVPGCRTEFVINQSSRHGVRPTEFVLHYTVSPNVAGWGDVNSVVNLFNHSSAQASSNFVLDGEGHCAYIVPLEAKAWTQAAANPFSVSVEVIDTGRESTYIAPAGLKQLRVIARTVSARTGIPLRRGRVSNCQPVVSGIVNHDDFGICGGGHVDITPFSVGTVVKQIAAGARPSKKSVWIRHRKAVHLTYVAQCPRHHRGTAQCSELRARARALDRLIARK
jgi:hypothetical protein